MLTSVKIWFSDVFLHERACVNHKDIAECIEWEGRGTIADGNGDFVVACDSSPCKGFFAYSPPNDSASASELFKYAYDRYRHAGVKVPDGEQKDIFMPMVEGGLECIKKWKDGQKEGKKRQVSSVSIVSQNIKTSPYSL
jgi:hypothetical protein